MIHYTEENEKMSKKTLYELCRLFKGRAETLGYKGKKRDDAMMDYFSGALVALHATGQKEEYEHVAAVTSMVLSVRGYKELEVILKMLGPEVEAEEKAMT